MSQEILNAIETSNRAFEEFKKVNDARIEELKKGGVTADMQAKMAAIQADMAEQKRVIEDMEAKAKRPHFGADGREINQAEAEHKQAFNSFMRKGKTDGLADLEAKAYAWSTNSGADGGYAVPKVIDATIDALAVNVSPIRALAQVVQVSTTDYHKLVNKHGTASGWVGETDARPATNTSVLADIKPTMGELYANPQATQQMLDDVFFNAEQWLAEEVALEFARAEGAAFITGDGTNKPTGFLAGATAATADSSRAFGTIEHIATGTSGAWKTLSATVNPADDLFTVVSKMKAAYRAGSSWVTNKALLFEIMAFKDYQGRYVFNPTTAPGVADTILGYPVVEAEDIAAKGANSLSLAFGNFKLGYLIVDRIGTRVVRDPFSNKPYIGFYTTKRVGGALINSEAIKVLKFSAS
jgi:HK97 family phage major capsid protein